MADDTREVTIGNLGDIAKHLHVCTSQPQLTEILVAIGRMDEALSNQAAASQELSARFEEQSRHITQVLNQRHECYQVAELRRTSAAIDYLKEELHKQQGSSKWEDRLWNIGQALVVAVMVAVVLFIMGGGIIK